MESHSRIEERIIKKLAAADLLYKEVGQLRRKRDRLKIYGEAWEKLNKKILKLTLQGSEKVSEAGRILVDGLKSGRVTIIHAEK